MTQVEREPPFYILAAFASLMPGFPLVSPTYPTRDHWIPAEWFDLLYAEVDAMLAMAESVGTNAHAIGKRLVEDGKSSNTKRLVKNLHVRAFPRLYRSVEVPRG